MRANAVMKTFFQVNEFRKYTSYRLVHVFKKEKYMQKYTIAYVREILFI